MQTIRWLSEITQGDAAVVGAKAAALGELRRTGINVPDGFVLTTSAYAQVIQIMKDRLEQQLTPAVIDDPGELEPTAGQVRDAIVAEPWPPDLVSELSAARQSLDAQGSLSYAARTSLATEQLATAFGAGVERAVLGLVGQEALQRGIAACWAALWTSRSIYYRFRKKIPQTGVALAVLVQPMVRAESAGILFTDNSSVGGEKEVQLDSIWGLGAPLTQARVHPDRFRVSRMGGAVVGRQLEHKNVAQVVAADGSVEQQALSPERAEASSLTETQVQQLARLGLEIEKLFGEPQDIEWARRGDVFYILQARPMRLRNS